MSTSPPHPELHSDIGPSPNDTAMLLSYFLVLSHPAISRFQIRELIMALSRILAANIDGRTQNTRYRQSQFQKLQSTLVTHVAEIQDAILSDSSHTRTEVRAEVIFAMQEIRTHFSSLSLEKDLEAEYRVSHGKDNSDRTRGAGIVYIVPSAHTLFFSVISALSAALAAGNCIVLEVISSRPAITPLTKYITATSNNKCAASFITQDSARCFGPRYLCDHGEAARCIIPEQSLDGCSDWGRVCGSRLAFKFENRSHCRPHRQCF
jgi:acyl-CoA reductase-like NAD-dependent aldehyde dehydrogenase